MITRLPSSAAVRGDDWCIADFTGVLEAYVRETRVAALREFDEICRHAISCKQRERYALFMLGRFALSDTGFRSLHDTSV
jgi:hypothetical protein